MGFPSSLLLACFPKGKTAYGELFDLFWQSLQKKTAPAQESNTSGAKALMCALGYGPTKVVP
jgi:hypothetical protein